MSRQENICVAVTRSHNALKNGHSQIFWEDELSGVREQVESVRISLDEKCSMIYLVEIYDNVIVSYELWHQFKKGFTQFCTRFFLAYEKIETIMAVGKGCRTAALYKKKQICCNSYRSKDTADSHQLLNMPLDIMVSRLTLKNKQQ